MTSHFYTADSNERNNAIQNLRFSDEGIACYLFSTQVPGSAPLFRAWHPPTGAHLYTMNVAERDRATTTLGYVAEGITGYIYGGQQPGTNPLYRAYQPTSDDHFYTADQGEHNHAVQQLGYTDEGVAGYVLAGATSGAVPLYRMYGPTSAAPAQRTEPVFPITASRDDNFPGSGGFMHTDVTVPENSERRNAHLGGDRIQGFRRGCGCCAYRRQQDPTLGLSHSKIRRRRPSNGYIGQNRELDCKCPGSVVATGTRYCHCAEVGPKERVRRYPGLAWRHGRRGP